MQQDSTGERNAGRFEEPELGEVEAGGIRKLLTWISAYVCSGQLDNCVVSSSCASIGCGACDAILRLSFWQLAGMPVMGSRRAFRWLMDHDGVTRRSDEDEFSEVIRSGISAAVFMVGVR